MTNDQELLQDAAKAVGLMPCAEGTTYRFYKGGSIFFDRGANSFTWNPLADDGDALRLAVKLSFNVYHAAASVFVEDLDVDVEVYEGYEGDKLAATRRAIVRAAAEIGKQLKENHDA